MGFKIVLTLFVLVAVASAFPGAAGPSSDSDAPAPVNPFALVPPWIASAPWFPKWGPCSTIGKSCLDCNTKHVCIGISGFQIACTDPTLPYCNLGECTATPSAECVVPAVPANVAA